VGALRWEHHSGAASRRRGPEGCRAHEGRASSLVATPRLGVGIIGIGFGQAVHAPVFQSDARSEVVAICASTKERARAVADRLNIPQAFGDWRAVVASPDVAAVSIAVPPALQPEIAIAAARAGKHVFCEKPLALSCAQAEAMLDVVRASGVANAIDLEFAELPAYRAAEQLLRSGQLGAIDSVAFTWEVRTRSRPADSWKEQAGSGGGSLGGFAAHAIYLIERLFAPVVRLSSP